MATCLVTISGTTGEVLINYVDSGSDPRTLTAAPGQLYLDDTGTDYEWTNLSGDAAVSSGCVTFTEIESNCYIIDWQQISHSSYIAAEYKFDAVVVGATTSSINESNFPGSALTLANSINALNLDTIKAVGYKVVSTASVSESYLIVKVQGTDIPYIKIKNIDDTHYIYLKGTLTVNCLPTGYTAIQTCTIGSVLA